MRSSSLSPAAALRVAPPFSGILCAVDTSPVGAACAEFAYGLVRDAGTVYLLHVVTSRARVRPLEGGALHGAPVPEARRLSRAWLADLVPDGADERGIHTRTILAGGADPAEEIALRAAVLGVDAIVLGTHGVVGPSPTGLGPVASDVVRSSATPAFLVHPGPADGLPRGLPPRSILCPTDLTERSNAAVGVAHALAGESTTVHLLHVRERAVAPWDDSEGEGRDRLGSARRALHAVARAHATREVRTELHVVDGDDPAAALHRASIELRADLLVLSTHGRTGLHGPPMGAVALEALRCACPTLLVPRLDDEAE
jgi:nucleotide-binding universal stress UspA family protein